MYQHKTYADPNLYTCLLMPKPNTDLQTLKKNVLQVYQISTFAIVVLVAFENKHWFEISFLHYNVRYCTSVTFKTLVTSKC